MNYTEEDIMNPNTGKKTLILASDSVFINTKCLFVEYEDVIKAPLFILLFILRDNELVSTYFDLSSIKDVSPKEVLEFYLNRKVINPLCNFPLNSSLKPEEGLYLANELIKNSYDLSPSIFGEEAFLNFALTLSYVLKDPNFIKDCRVYTRYHHTHIENDLKEMYGNRVKYVYGEFKEVAKLVPKDSTFVLSDIEKVKELYDIDNLSMNSIILADNYRYNYNSEGEYKVDIVKLSEDCPYKFNAFDNISSHSAEPFTITKD